MINCSVIDFLVTKRLKMTNESLILISISTHNTTTAQIALKGAKLMRQKVLTWIHRQGGVRLEMHSLKINQNVQNEYFCHILKMYGLLVTKSWKYCFPLFWWSSPCSCLHLTLWSALVHSPNTSRDLFSECDDCCVKTQEEGDDDAWTRATLMKGICWRSMIWLGSVSCNFCYEN